MCHQCVYIYSVLGPYAHFRLVINNNAIYLWKFSFKLYRGQPISLPNIFAAELIMYMIASLKVADANSIKILKNYGRKLLVEGRPGVRMDF